MTREEYNELSEEEKLKVRQQAYRWLAAKQAQEEQDEYSTDPKDKPLTRAAKTLGKIGLNAAKNVGEVAVPVLETAERGRAAVLGAMSRGLHSAFGKEDDFGEKVPLTKDITNIISAERTPSEVFKQNYSRDPDAASSLPLEILLSLTPVGAVKTASKLGLKGVAKTLDKISNPIGRSQFGKKTLEKKGEQLYNFANKYTDINPNLITKQPKTWVDDGSGTLVPIYDDIPMFKKIEARNPHLRSVSLEKQLKNVKEHTDKQGEILNQLEKGLDSGGYKINMQDVLADTHTDIKSKLKGASGGRADAALMEEARMADDIVKGTGRTRVAKNPQSYAEDFSFTVELDLAREKLVKEELQLVKDYKKFGKFTDDTPADELLIDVMSEPTYKTLPPDLRAKVYKVREQEQNVERLKLLEDARIKFKNILDEDAGKNFDLDDKSIKQLAEKYHGSGIKDPRAFLNAEMQTGLGEVGVKSANWLRRTINVDNFTKQYVEHNNLNKSEFAKATGMKLPHFAKALKKNNDMILDRMAKEMPEELYQKMMAKAKLLADPEQLKMIENRQLSKFWNDASQSWLLGKRKAAVLGDALSGGGTSKELTYAVGAGLAGTHHPVMQVRAVVGIPGYIGRFMGQGMMKYGDKTTKFLNKASYQYFQEIARREPEFEFYGEQLENLEEE